MKRRQFINAASVIAVGGQALTARAQGVDIGAGLARRNFGFEDVIAIAKKRAAQVYAQPVAEQVGSFADLSYDQYRGIRFRREMDPLKGRGGYSLDLLPPGMIYYEPVNIHVVRNGVPLVIGFDPHMLEFDPSQFPGGADPETTGDMGWSGFRLRTTLNKPGVMDEFLVFQGASYFRAVARDTLYGLSARGLAIKTGSPEGEEFPLFTDFWIHDPSEGVDYPIRIHALLDSKSVTGAYQFDVNPGAVTMIRTRVTLFPRVDLREIGLAPLTSMFWFSPASHHSVDDYRPAVHDSDGLQMHTGAGQALWRSLSSSKTLQITSFVDKNPRGFGLIQRRRKFEDYQDAEAMYHLRPSAWIKPEGEWGEGEIRLIEIPVDSEVHDNIVSYWMPKEQLTTGKRHDFRYSICFSAVPPNDLPSAKVLQVRSGRSINDKNCRSYIVDFDLSLFSEELPETKVTASNGEIAHTYLKPLPEQHALRLAFEFQPGSAQFADLQAVLTSKDGAELSETWMTYWCV